MKKKDVIDYFGSASATARALRISRQALHSWPEELTERIAFRVELATYGKLKTKETIRNEHSR